MLTTEIYVDTVEGLSFLCKPPSHVQVVEGQQVTLSYLLKGSLPPQGGCCEYEANILSMVEIRFFYIYN